MAFKDKWVAMIATMQNNICAALEQADGKAKFQEDLWQRPEGGGGRTRVIENGNIFEKGGVNTSAVFGEVTNTMRSQLNINGDNWFACGLSLVIHPYSPMVPTIHCNYRMFEMYDANGTITDRWFGGGTDLTPYYLFAEDATLFHENHKVTADRFNPEFYPVMKITCDSYFVNAHRNNERRGIGGIFYDHRRPDAEQDELFWYRFAEALGKTFVDTYIPIVQKRKDLPFGGKEKYWQEIRRGRYTEFNLVHDRGTIFGLKTNGRTESILMSLPPTVRFDYNYEPQPGSPEAELLDACLHPRDWV